MKQKFNRKEDFILIGSLLLTIVILIAIVFFKDFIVFKMLHIF